MAIQTTINTAANTAYFNKQFYDKKLLETAKTRIVHAEYGQKRNIPKNSGKKVEFRKYDLFAPDKMALTLQEGVTPDGQSLSQSKVEAEVKQYGAYVEVSDLLDLTAYDEVIADSAELLGEQLGVVIDRVTRDAMSETTNVQYTGGHEERENVAPTDTLTVNDIQKAVRNLKKNKARLFMSAADGSVRKPHFVCICSPDATYDLQNDPLWQDVSKYSNAEQIYSGEIGRLFGVVFVESPEAKIYRQSVYQTLQYDSIAGTNYIRINKPTSDIEMEYLSTGGNSIYSGKAGEWLELRANNPLVYENGDWRLYVQGSAFTSTTAPTVKSLICSDDGGKAISSVWPSRQHEVHATLVFGADAYGVIDIDGSGTVETIIKPHGSSGSLDPLNQRATVGAKVAAYAAKILNPLWIVRIEHGVSG
ncbi:MAG: N4-gp56 family major capsid protein [Clostridiales bacterium]|nr:N4-gp56 family major capsid protein [Clostridiales bacterium]